MENLLENLGKKAKRSAGAQAWSSPPTPQDRLAEIDPEARALPHNHCVPALPLSSALSAGGPIIHPELDVWTILPMLPQSISSRPFVISSSEKVNINLLRGPLKSAKICADGQEDISAPYLEDIKISKMEDKLRLVHPLDNDFFEACREKLGWSLDISKQKL